MRGRAGKPGKHKWQRRATLQIVPQAACSSACAPSPLPMLQVLLDHAPLCSARAWLANATNQPEERRPPRCLTSRMCLPRTCPQIVFSEGWWVGTAEENPEERRLPDPDWLALPPLHQKFDFSGRGEL